MKHVENRPARHVFVHLNAAAEESAAPLSPDGSLFPFSTPHPQRFLTNSSKVSFGQDEQTKEKT